MLLESRHPTKIEIFFDNSIEINLSLHFLLVQQKMGILFSKTYITLFRNRNTKLLMLGLDAAGKTTILYKLKLGEKVMTIPTIGFNVEQIDYDGFNMQIWDIGSQDKIRKLWKYYYNNSEALIFVVDSNDISRIDEAKEVLQATLEDDEMRNTALLVYANSQDLPDAIKQDELSRKLCLDKIRNRAWHIQGTCSAIGDGMYEALSWLGQEPNKH